MPILPGWISGGGWLPLAAIGITVIGVCVNTGTSYGDADGWSLFLALTLPAAPWLWSSFTRRTRELEHRKRLELRSRIKITETDHLNWQDFEKQCITLLQLLGYKNVKKTRNIPGAKAVDITAADPGSGKPEIFECKHRKLALKSVGVGEVDQLIGRIASGMYLGLPVTLMTNARVTDGARKKAALHSITVTGREQLAELMAQATGEPGNRAPDRQTPGLHDRDAAEVPAEATGLIATWFRALRPETKFATAVSAASCLAVLITVLQMAMTGPRPAVVPFPAPMTPSAAANSSRAAHPPATSPSAGNGETPEAVTRKYLTAISDRNWPEVWQLGGKNIGRGPSATYRGMVAGYLDTIRDVPVTMTAAGNTVSGRFLAYETGNRVQTYTFIYVIRDGAIIRATLQAAATTN